MEQAGTMEKPVENDAGSVADIRERLAPNAKEADYMRGGAEPVTSSILVSSSKYLNDPYFRDVFAQFALRKMGDDLPATYLIPNMSRALNEVRDNEEFYRLIQEERAKKPDFAAWLDRRRLTRYNPAEMRDHRPGTLGALIRDFIENSGMEMQFRMADVEPRNDVEYILKRRSAHHDIEHMVTGFGPNAYGETALSVMNLTSTLSHFTPALAKHLNEASMFVSATGLYRASLHCPDMMPGYLEAWQKALTAGRSIRKALMMVDWEDYLDMTLDEIAEDLGFERGPGAAWDYSNVMIGGRY